jgi:O-antigen/teichoic acid export membrane protein
VQTAFTLNLVIGVLLTGLAMLVAPAIAGFFQVPEHVDLFRLGAANILIIGLGNIQDSLLLRELEFRRRIVPEFLRAVVRGVVSIALAFAGFEAAALVWGMLAGSLVWTATQWALTRFRPTSRSTSGSSGAWCRTAAGPRCSSSSPSSPAAPTRSSSDACSASARSGSTPSPSGCRRP